MARPRSSARPITKAVYGPSFGQRLHPVLAELLEAEDPAIPAITVRITEARLAGANVRDEHVLEQCITAGRADHAALTLDGAA